MKVIITHCFGPRSLGYETSLKKIMGWKHLEMVQFDLGPPTSRLSEGSHIYKYESLIIDP